jgi:serine/threonine protein kinase
MLSGRSPFLKETAAETMTAILHQDPPALAGTERQVPPGLGQIVRRCLEKRPQERFSTAHDLAFALEAAAPTRRVAKRFRSHAARETVRILVATAAAAIVVLVNGLLVRSEHGSCGTPVQSAQGRGAVRRREQPALSPNGTEIAYTASERGSATSGSSTCGAANRSG